MLKITNKHVCIFIVVIVLFFLLTTCKKKKESFNLPELSQTKDRSEDGYTWNSKSTGKNTDPTGAKCSKQCCVAGSWPTPFSVLSPNETPLEPGTFVPSNDSCYGYNSSGCVCLDPNTYGYVKETNIMVTDPTKDDTTGVVAGNYFSDGFMLIDKDVNMNLNGEPVKQVNFGSYGRCDIRNAYKSTATDDINMTTGVHNYPTETPTYGEIYNSFSE